MRQPTVGNSFILINLKTGGKGNSMNGLHPCVMVARYYFGNKCNSLQRATETVFKPLQACSSFVELSGKIVRSKNILYKVFTQQSIF